MAPADCIPGTIDTMNAAIAINSTAHHRAHSSNSKQVAPTA